MIVLLLLLAPTALAFVVPYHRCRIPTTNIKSNPPLFSSSTTNDNWNTCTQPRFDEFANCIVGPWSNINDPKQQDEVEEVMRSCGGAIQGIRELPLSLISPEEYKTTEEEEQRMYHNRADGGFVYFDDGSYTSGAEKLEITSSNDSLMMTSLQFSNRHRIWMTVNTHDALEAIDTFNDEMQQILNLKMLEISRPVSASGEEEYTHAATTQLSATEIPNVNWKQIQRVRMPNTNQAWSLARAKWEKQDDESTNEEDEAVKRNDGKLIGWSFVSQDEPDSYTINLMAACTASGVARLTVRCYDTNDGTLKSVALLYGSIISTASTISTDEDETS